MLDIFTPVFFHFQSNSHVRDLTLHWSGLYQSFLRYYVCWWKYCGHYLGIQRPCISRVKL